MPPLLKALKVILQNYANKITIYASKSKRIAQKIYHEGYL